MHFRLLSLGFGNVGRALARMLVDKEAELAREYGLTFSFTGAVTRRGGAWIAPEGISAKALLDSPWPRGEEPAGTQPFEGDAMGLIDAAPADVVLELTTLAPASGEPALTHVRHALGRGRHVVTANKGPIAHGYAQLEALAREKGRGLRFESTVMDGTPIFGLRESCLPATVISRVEGPLNSTSNFILDLLQQGMSFAEALSGAQTAGIAEAEPSADLEGFDAAVKLCVISAALMDAQLRPLDVRRVGLGVDAMIDAVDRCPKHHVVKQLGRAERVGNGVEARVELVTLPKTHVFATLKGMEAGLRLTTDTMGELTIIEGEGGPGQTAFGLVADLVHLARQFPAP